MAAHLVATLAIALQAQTSTASSNLSQLQQQLVNMQASANTSTGGVSSAVVAMGTVIGNVITGVISKLASMTSEAVATGIGFNRMQEQAQIAFTNLLGSADKAKGFMKELSEFAARTPFELQGLTQSAQRLTAMGFAANDVIPMLDAAGNAVAAMGGSAESVNRVTTALTQMRAKGKVSAEEMMQLAEAGIPAWQILSEKIGKSIPDAMKLAEKGAINADVAVRALVDGMQDRFGGMMEQQSHTFSGLMSTISDTAQQALGSVLQPLFASATDGMQVLVDILPTLQSGLDGVSDSAKLAGVAFTGLAIAAGLAGIAVAAALGGPAGLAVAALGAQVAIVSAAIISNFGQIGSAITAWTGGTQVSFSNVLRWIGMGADGFAVFARTVISGVDVIGTALTILAQTFRGIMGMLQGFATSVKGVLTFDPTTIVTGISQMEGAWTKFDTGVSTQIRALSNRIKTNLQDSVDNMNGKYARGFENFGNTVSKAFAKISDAATASGQKVKVYDSLLSNIKPPSLDVPGTKKGGKSATDELNKMLKEQLDVVNNWTKETKQALTLNAEVWKILPVEIRKVLLQTATAFHDNINETKAWGAALQAAFLKAAHGAGDISRSLVVSIKGTKIEITSAQIAVKDARTLDINPNLWADLAGKASKGNAAAQAALKAIRTEMTETGRTLNLIVPKIDQDFSILQGTMAGTAIASKSATDQMSDGIEAWEKRTKRALDGVKGKLTWSDLFAGVMSAPPKPLNPEKFGLGKELAEAVKKLKDDISSSLGAGIGGALVSLAGKFNWHLDKVKSWASDIDLVIGEMPGKFGQMAQGVYGTLKQWANWFNGILSIISKLNSSVPSSVGGLVSKIVDIFKNASSKSGSGGLLGGLIGGAGGLLGKVLGGGAPAISSGASILGSMGWSAGAQAGVAGAAGGAGGGSMLLGALGGPWGIAAMAGAAVIALIGKLFKSSAQKEQERVQREQAKLQLEQTRLSIQQTRQDLMRGAIEIGSMFTEFADKLSDYSKVPKGAFAAFNKDMLKFASGFGETAAQISPEVSAGIKQLGEALQPALESSNLFLELAEGLNRYVGVAKSSIKRFGADFTILIGELASVYESLTKQQIKLARKLGEKSSEPIQLVKDYLAATLDFGNLRALTKEGIASLKEGIGLIVEGIADIASKTDLGLVKEGTRFAERAIRFTELIKSAREAFAGDFIFAGGSIAQSLDALYQGILLASEKTTAISRAIGEDALLETATAAEQLGKIVSIWKDASEGFKAVVAVKDDPTMALDLLYAAVLTATEKTVLIARAVGTEMLNQAKDAAVAIKEVVSILKDSSDGFTSLKEFFNSTKDFDFNVGAARLQGGILVLLEMLISLSRGVPQAMMNEAATFASGMKPVFESFNSVFASFKEIVSGQATIKDAMLALQSALDDAIVRARGLTNTATGFLNQSAQFRNLMREAAGNFQQGLSFQAGGRGPDHLVVSGSGGAQAVLRSSGSTTVINNYTTTNNIAPGAFVVDPAKYKNLEEFMKEMERRWSQAGGIQQATQTI